MHITGKWHKDFFTNRDVADILTAMATASIEKKDERDLFYSIVKSRFPNCTMSQYKLYGKAKQVKLTQHFLGSEWYCS